MKPRARILAFKGRDLRTAAELAAAEEALMIDLMAGDITPAESKKIQSELTQRIKAIGSAFKTAGELIALKRMSQKLQEMEQR
jgi:hypothetical protein